MTNPHLTLRAYRGDFKTLLAFDLPRAQAQNLAGFTIECHPPHGQPYYLLNNLTFADPARHAQVDGERPDSSINAPIHKFRWLHVPGSFHQGLAPETGLYRYVVTPRYLKNEQLQAFDPALGASISVEVGPYESADKKFAVGFTRGYVQSQAFKHHFGEHASIQPRGRGLLYDTKALAGTTDGQSYDQMYEWLGFTARQRIFEFLDAVLADPEQQLCAFAYDLNEPDVCERLLQLAAQGRVRIIVDNADLHHGAAGTKMEDRFEAAFTQAATGDAGILRGRFARYAHDKVFIASKAGQPIALLTGSTNFSVTGLYVNSNHVLVYRDAGAAALYARLFDTVWQQGVKATPFVDDDLSQHMWPVATEPMTAVSFAPHSKEIASAVLGTITRRIQTEVDKGGSILFAVMELEHGASPVWDALKAVHDAQKTLSFGISDSTANISLYEPGKPGGVLVTGKPTQVLLPPPFDQVEGVGLGHQIHHKFVVCGFNSDNPVVFCGSSNLALGGEHENGDNLLEIRDAGVAAVFAIEAIALVDHFQFMNRLQQKQPGAPVLTKLPVSKSAAAKQHQWFLSTSDHWVVPYYEAGSAQMHDREFFAGTGGA